jgi:hypothetical protein
LKRIFVGECYRSWSFRYLKEAKADFSFASEASTIESVRDFSTIALRKAQLAIQYALAQPELLEAAVLEYMATGDDQGEPLIMLLARIRKVIEDISEPTSRLAKNSILDKTSLVIDVTKSIVSECFGNR